MRLLLLSFYFEPDLCAGSFRATPLASALSAHMGGEGTVDVITTQPNRYSSYTPHAPSCEKRSGLTVRRIKLPPHRSGVIDQGRAFMRFAVEVLRMCRGVHYDIVVATSSRLMTAVLGAAVARRTGARLYLDLRDIFPDTLKDLYADSPARLLVPIFSGLERWAVRSSSRVNLVSGGFVDYFSEVDPTKLFSIIPNGIDEEFVEASFKKERPSTPLKIVYAGNIGLGQGLDRIVPGMAAALGDDYEFVIVGDGGARDRLLARLSPDISGRVEIMPPVSREELIRVYRDADVLFVHLNDHAAFRKVLPSKLFEYAATGKPILAGISGFAARFVEDSIPNAAVFTPCSVAEGCAALARLQLEHTARGAFSARYRRSRVSKDLAADVLARPLPQAH